MTFVACIGCRDYLGCQARQACQKGTAPHQAHPFRGDPEIGGCLDCRFGPGTIWHQEGANLEEAAPKEYFRKIVLVEIKVRKNWDRRTTCGKTLRVDSSLRDLRSALDLLPDEEILTVTVGHGGVA